MPQLSSCKLILVDADSKDVIVSKVKETLNRLEQDLENEISGAIVEENVDLAERLMLPISRVKKLSAFLDNLLSQPLTNSMDIKILN